MGRVQGETAEGSRPQPGRLPDNPPDRLQGCRGPAAPRAARSLPVSLSELPLEPDARPVAGPDLRGRELGRGGIEARPGAGPDPRSGPNPIRMGRAVPT